MWMMGLYVNNAVFVAVDHALNGRKATSRYMEEPISMMSEECDDKSDFLKFSAWAEVYNEKIQDGQV